MASMMDYRAPEDRELLSKTVGSQRDRMVTHITLKQWDRARRACVISGVSLAAILRTLLVRWADVVIREHEDA